MVRYRKLSDKKYLKTQKEAFPIIYSKRDAKFFNLKVKNKEIFILKLVLDF